MVTIYGNIWCDNHTEQCLHLVQQMLTMLETMTALGELGIQAPDCAQDQMGHAIHSVHLHAASQQQRLRHYLAAAAARCRCFAGQSPEVAPAQMLLCAWFDSTLQDQLEIDRLDQGCLFGSIHTKVLKAPQIFLP